MLAGQRLLSFNQAKTRSNSGKADGEPMDTANDVQAPGFGSVLKTSLDQVNKTQEEATRLGKAFELGDRSVSLNDVMVSLQKASISFQGTVQVRNKLVQAYHEIMNMQI
jgi:flagellar hook-basal body complex protein FliE